MTISMHGCLQAAPTFVHEQPPLGDGGCVEDLAANVLQDHFPPTGLFSPSSPRCCEHAVFPLLLRLLLVTFPSYDSSAQSPGRKSFSIENMISARDEINFRGVSVGEYRNELDRTR